VNIGMTASTSFVRRSVSRVDVFWLAERGLRVHTPQTCQPRITVEIPVPQRTRHAFAKGTWNSPLLLLSCNLDFPLELPHVIVAPGSAALLLPFSRQQTRQHNLKAPRGKRCSSQRLSVKSIRILNHVSRTTATTPRSEHETNNSGHHTHNPSVAYGST